MTIKTVARRNWPERRRRQHVRDLVRAATTSPSRSGPRSPGCSSHDEVTGLATPGDVRLLRDVVAAERDRMAVADAERCW